MPRRETWRERKLNEALDHLDEAIQAVRDGLGPGSSVAVSGFVAVVEGLKSRILGWLERGGT